MRSGVNDRVYISAKLELQATEDSTFQATLSWPAGRYYTQNSIDLSAVLSGAMRYYRRLDGFAKGLGSLPAQEVEDFENFQSEFSADVFKAVFIGGLETVLGELVDAAHGRKILLEVDLPEGALEILPWELIGDSKTAVVKGESRSISVTVYRKNISKDKGDLVTEGGRPGREGKVRLMRVGSQPYRRSGLHTGAEFSMIEGSFKENPNAIILPGRDVDYDNMDYDSFNKALFKNQPQILHLACHGNSSFVDFSRGETEQLIPHSMLVSDICSIDGIRLVVLNVCYSSSFMDSSGGYIRGLASALAGNGISAVVGMAASFTDLAAIEFSRWFYSALGQGRSVCEAYHNAVTKVRVFNQGDKNLWSVPMLYVKENINPFMEILAEAGEYNGSPYWPIEYIEDTIYFMNEFSSAFKRIKPHPQWSAYNWQMETRKVFRIYVQTLKQLKALGSQFSSAKYLEHRAAVVGILSLQSQIVSDLEDFSARMPNWGGMDFKDPLTAGVTGKFMRDGANLVEKMEHLTARLESILKNRA